MEMDTKKPLNKIPPRVQRVMIKAHLVTPDDVRKLIDDNHHRFVDLLRSNPNFGSRSWRWLCLYADRCPDCVRGICRKHGVGIRGKCIAT